MAIAAWQSAASGPPCWRYQLQTIVFEAEEDRVLDEGGESGESAAEARRE